MEIISYNYDLKKSVFQFLENASGFKIDEKIINNASFIINNQEIQAMIAFEKYDGIGLIRYFVFKKTVSSKDVFELVLHLESKALEQKVSTLIALVNNQEVEEVFTLLGFSLVSPENVYFDETIFQDTEYKNNKVFAKKIIKDF